MPAVGWVGLGKLGTPMARHVAARFPVVAFDTDPARLVIPPAGMTAAPSVTAVAAAAEVLLLSLPDDAALLAVVDQVVPHLHPAAILVDTSTVSPGACDAVRARWPAYVAAPVSGSTATAEAASLTAFCSGPGPALAAAHPVLACFARTIHVLGAGSEARWMKLAINHFVATTAQVAAEALTLARRGGVAWAQALDVLGASVAASPLVAYKLAPLRARDFAAAFSVDQMVKDTGLVHQAAEAAGTPARLAALVHALYRDQAVAGLGALDFFAAILDAERRSGLGEPEPT